MTELRILIVEDNTDTAKGYREGLRLALGRELGALGVAPPQSVEILIAASVPAATGLIETKRFDLVIVDLKVPGAEDTEMGGLEVAAGVQRVDPLCPVIVVTGYATADLATRSFHCGVDDVIEKSPEILPQLLRASAKALEERQQKLFRVGNPFVPTSGREPPVYGGRQSAFDFFQERVSRAVQKGVLEHFLVLGGWGMGKTTLLKQFKKIAQTQGSLAAVVSLDSADPGRSENEMADALLQGILRDVSVPRSRLSNLTHYFGSVGITILGSGFELSRRDQASTSPQALLSDALENLWKDVRGQAHLVVVLIDDIDHKVAAPNALRLLRAVLESDRMQNTRILVGIASTPGYWGHFAAIPEHGALARYFRPHLQLQPLGDDDVVSTVELTTRETGVRFSPEVMQALTHAIQGHPGKLQLLCYHLFKSQRGGLVDLDAWDNALHDAIYELELTLYRPLFEQLEPGELDVLRVLADPGGEQRVDGLLDRLSGGRWPSLPHDRALQLLDRLGHLGLVRRSGSSYRIDDHFVAEYVKQRSG